MIHRLVARWLIAEGGVHLSEHQRGGAALGLGLGLGIGLLGRGRA